MIKTLPLYKTQSVDCQAVQQAFDEANFSLAAKDPQLEKTLEKHWPDLERTLISQAYCMRVDTQQGNTYGTYIASLTQPHIDEEVVTVLRVYCEELNFAGLCERPIPVGTFSSARTIVRGIPYPRMILRLRFILIRSRKKLPTPILAFYCSA